MIPLVKIIINLKKGVTHGIINFYWNRSIFIAFFYWN